MQSHSAEIETVNQDEVALASSPVEKRRGAFVTAIPWAVIGALSLMILFGFGLRLSGIARIGFAEDETNKIEAVRAYERGDITPNAEHPMVMKALMHLSMQAAHAWNAAHDVSSQISDETALRFPNLLMGALTVIPLFLLTSAFFDRWTGLLASALWAFGVNAITYNRTAKEDTLLVFFMLFAFYFYLRAKQTSGHNAKVKRWYYSWSGVSFGLMLASKYFPHYFGLNMLYHHLFRVREQREPGEPQGKTPLYFYILMFVVFFVVNPAVFLPQTWQYLQAYTSGQLLSHTGYLLGEHLYKNTMSSTPFWGTPLYFYLLFLAIKVPLPVLISLVMGLYTCVRRWRHPGHGFLLLMFLLWIVPYSVMGAKWLRYTLSLMPFVYMIAAVGVMALVRWCASLLEKKEMSHAPRFALTALLLLFFIAWPAFDAYASRPHYALYVNTLGHGRAGYYFPHDELYDDGLREAIEFVCRSAPQGALIVHETPGVVRYYLEKFKRTDLQSRVLSDPQFRVDDQSEAYVILQRGRTYFENRDEMQEVRAKYPLVYASCVDGQVAAEVYATNRSKSEALIKPCTSSEP